MQLSAEPLQHPVNPAFTQELGCVGAGCVDVGCVDVDCVAAEQRAKQCGEIQRVNI